LILILINVQAVTKNNDQNERIIVLNERTKILSEALDERFERNGEIINLVTGLMKKIDILEREGLEANVHRHNYSTVDFQAFQTNESFIDITSLISNLAPTNRVIESFIDERMRRANLKFLFLQNKAAEIIDSYWSNVAFSNCNNMRITLPPYSLNNLNSSVSEEDIMNRTPNQITFSANIK
jgi:hypothetical protein